ncbi:MAG: helix-turn-helix transcriptional regulator [Gemmatimonadota bacterium]|nr:helix-turn-helix transcriptional regulator [Gemmatimonadota bacterium]
MGNPRDDWGFGPGFPFGSKTWAGVFNTGGRGSRRRSQMFESGEVKFVILRLLKEKPRHGYEIIKALEEKMAGCYTPSAGTVYPTLQLLEDEGYIRAVDTNGKKVYHVTPEGERYLEEHRDLLDEILDRVRETVRDFTGGGIGEVQGAFAHLAGVTFRKAWRRSPDDPALKQVAEILRRAAGEIEEALKAGQRDGGARPEASAGAEPA